MLSHEPSAIVTDRMARGLPLLLDHDTRTHVGRIEALRIEDGRVRGRPRFSRSALGREVEQDYRDGIRVDVSVSYRVLAWEQVGERDGVPVIEVTRWEPLEGSLVAVPADINVGVGRSDQAARAPTTEHTAAIKGGTMTDVTTPAAAAAGLAPEMRNALQAATALGLEHAEQLRMVAQGANAQAILEAALAAQERRIAAAPSAAVEMSPKEQQSYSLVRGIQAMLRGKRSGGVEWEVSEELERRFGAGAKGGLLVPTNIRAPLAHGKVGARSVLNIGTATKGGVLEFDEYGGFVDFLRARAVSALAGANIRTGLTGDFALVEQTGSPGLTWGTEQSGASAASMDLNIKRMQPKQATARAPYTRMLEAQSVESIEDLVRADIFGSWAVGVDAVALNGGGANQPTGVLANTSVSAVTIGAQGGTASYANWLALVQTVADQNALMGSGAFVTTPGVARNAMITPRFTNTGIPIWDGSLLDGLAANERAFATNGVPKTFTKGTTTGLHGIIFGNWEDLFIGQWGALEVWPDPYSAAPHSITVWAIGLVDVMLRRTASFATCKEAVGT